MKTSIRPEPATAPAVFGTLRNTAIGYHRSNGEPNIARATRRANHRPYDLIEAVTRINPTTQKPWVGRQSTKTTVLSGSLVAYPSCQHPAVHARSLTRLTDLIRSRRTEIGSRGRRLPAHQQALMARARLCNGDILTRLAAGFPVSIATVWHYLREAIDLLAGHADDLAGVIRRAGKLAYAIIDGRPAADGLKCERWASDWTAGRGVNESDVTSEKPNRVSCLDQPMVKDAASRAN